MQTTSRCRGLNGRFVEPPVDDGLPRTCRKCGKTKEAEEFYLRHDYNGARRETQCKDCRNLGGKKRRLEAKYLVLSSLEVIWMTKPFKHQVPIVDRSRYGRSEALLGE